MAKGLDQNEIATPFEARDGAVAEIYDAADKLRARISGDVAEVQWSTATSTG